MTVFCDVCGRGGQTAMIGNALEFKHFKPADHRFRVAGPRSAENRAEPPVPSALPDTSTSGRSLRFPRQPLVADER